MVTKCLFFNPRWFGTDDSDRCLCCADCRFWFKCETNVKSLSAMTLEQRETFVSCVNMQKHLEFINSKTSNLYE